ncbi:MAG TPA: hypothetical protein VF641_10010 [Methylobacterium sp.]
MSHPFPSEPAPLRGRTCLVLGVLVAVLGTALRLAVPVTPVDDGMRDVIRFHQSVGRP